MMVNKKICYGFIVIFMMQSVTFCEVPPEEKFTDFVRDIPDESEYDACKRMTEKLLTNHATQEDLPDLEKAHSCAVKKRDVELAKKFAIEMKRVDDGLVIKLISDHPMASTVFGIAAVVVPALVTYCLGLKNISDIFKR